MNMANRVLLILWLVAATIAGVAALELAAVAPRSALLAYAALQGTFLALFLAVVVREFTRPPDRPQSMQGIYDVGMAVLWGGSLATMGGFWLLAPYASESGRLLAVLMFMGFVLFIVVGTARPPSRGPRGPWGQWGLALLPLGFIGYYALHGGPSAKAMIGIMLGCLALTFFVRSYLQDRMNTAFEAVMELNAQREARARFLASASHDLEQPLQAARLSFEQALRARDACARSKAVDRIEQAFDAMEAMAGQITGHLKLESGGVLADNRPTEVGPLLARVVALVEPTARIASLSLHTLPSSLRVMGDALLIERTLGNFANNAVRHARAGKLLIGAKRCRGRVRLYVIDNGVGMPQADQARLFEDYVQGDHRGEVRGGYGLGLGSARRMAGLMQGVVGLDPRWRQGSAFFLELAAA